jgi:hypothetical protein
MLDFLKTMPDMTNTPEITMQEEAPKISMADRIRNYKAANPDAPVKQIAEAVGTHVVYVYQVLAGNTKKPNKAEVAKKKTDTLIAPKNKTDGFAIGVSQPHYWVISALASGRKTSRSAVLRDIIDQYIRDVLTEVKSDGTSV